MSVAMIGPKFYGFGKDGKPLAFGKLYTYQARTNTPKDTYQSEDQVVANDNPVILNGEGYANVYLSGAYKMVLKDEDDNEVWSADPVSASQPDEWVHCLPTTYLSPTSFEVNGNFTNQYEVGRSIRINNNTANYSYSTIQSATFAASKTSIVVKDSVITTGVIESCVSIIGKNSVGVGLVKSFDTILLAVNDKALISGDTLTLEERSTGNGGGATWDVVLASTVTPNDLNIVICVGVPTLALVLRRTKVFMSQHGIIGNEFDVVTKMKILQDQARALFYLPIVYDVELFIDESIILGGQYQEHHFLKNVSTTSTDPILEIKCSSSLITGVSKGNTTLYSPYSPDGIIHMDDEFISSIAYNDIGNFTVKSVLQPNTGGSKGLVMRSLDGYIQFTYFNKIHDLKFENCDTAGFLAGNINANFFKDIVMVNCGNEKTFTDSCGFLLVEAETTDNTPSGGGATRFEGPLENQFSDVFHTGSNNATSLFFSGKVYNNIISWSCETGGSVATSFKTVSSATAYGNVVTMTAIAFGGPDIDPDYFLVSSFNDGGNARILKVTSPDITAAKLQVGDTDGVDISLEGMFVGAAGINHITKDTTTVLQLNRKTSIGKVLDLRINGALGAEISVSGGDRMYLGTTAGALIQFTPDGVVPVSNTAAAKDNLISLGSASARWKEVYAGNAAINTSDEREKIFKDIEQTEKEVALVIKANIKKFVWTHSEERARSGGKKARIHFGVGAQFVGKCFTDALLNPDEYSLFCYDEWGYEYVTEPATFNDEGVELTPEVTRTTQEAGNRYGIRYSELAMFILSAI
tara:strand:- start:166 stop:2586 length:2421 start_codon:yes stop_codon:yes gene_type:complete